MTKPFSRRDFLRLAGATSAGLALSACGVRSDEFPTAAPAPTGTPLPTATLLPGPTPVPDTLRGYADALGIRIGAVVEGPDDKGRSRLLAEQFNQIVVTTIDWSVTRQGGENKYDFSIADRFIHGYAPGHHMSVTAMHLVYGDLATPAWLLNGGYSRDELIEIMQSHVAKTVGRYKGRARAYTVTNESTEPSIFWNRRIGPEYVELAFQAAREADPDAILIYNDYAHETASLSKADRVYELVSKLNQTGLVDAVGMQMHVIGGDNIDPRTPPSREELLAQIKRYGELGLKVFITELDVDTSLLPGDKDEKFARQAEIYAAVMEACLESNGICSDVNLWGVNDIETWSGEAALLFADNQPKPAYFAVLDVLRRAYLEKYT
jgi:endo-1,4-beta-xylanase